MINKKDKEKEGVITPFSSSEAPQISRQKTAGQTDYNFHDSISRAQNTPYRSASDIVKGFSDNRPQQYTGTYQAKIDETLDRILNGERFSYDMNADPLYQQYKSNYIRQGQNAMQDAIGQASALTGGYTNSYAQTVGQQAYNSYLEQLNDRIPELYSLAMQKYQMEQNQENNNLANLLNADNIQYSRYRDNVTDYENALANTLNAYQYDNNFNYQKDRDAVADRQWQSQFDYQKQRDSVSDQQWQQQFNENVRQFGLDYALSIEQAAASRDAAIAEVNGLGYEEALSKATELRKRGHDEDYIAAMLTDAVNLGAISDTAAYEILAEVMNDVKVEKTRGGFSITSD